MSDRNQRTPEQGSQNDQKKDKFSELMNAPAVFNRAGFAPTGAVFTLTKKMLNDEIVNIGRNEKLDIVDANIQYDMKNNVLSAFVFIPENSHHLVDDLSSNDQSAIRASIYNFSKELKIFIDKFAPEKERRVESANKPGLKCIYVDIVKIIDYLFDANGSAFNQKYNQASKRCKIRITPEVRGNEFIGITVEKKSVVQDKYELLPRKSHNF